MDARKIIKGGDERGAVLVETAIVFFTVMTLVFGIVEFGFVFYQWNSAAKATQVGARIAAVSAPVSPQLLELDGLANALPGNPYVAGDQYVVICKGSDTTKCECTAGCAGKTFTYNSTNMARIVTPMTKVFWRITAPNVIVKYEYTGLGYAGRPGGPVPTITVSLTGLTYRFILLSMFLPNPVQMPAFATTVSGEDLSNAGG